MKVLIDTNIVLDVVLDRKDFIADSRAVFEFAEHKKINGFITASCFTDIFYISNRQIKDTGIVYQLIDKLTVLFSIAPVSENTIKKALSLRWKDFEDAVQYIAAKENDITYIITRNKSDYDASDVICIDPSDFIQRFNKI